MAWKILIPRAISSANARIVNSGATRWLYAKTRDQWAKDIGNAMLGLRVPQATGRRRITITRLLGKGQKFFDDDDFVGGCKLVRDAMQRPHEWKTKNGVTLVPGASLIIEDSKKHSEFVYLQERAANGQPATLILIEDVP